MIANARMYSVSPRVAAAWNALLTWAIARADVECTVIDYAPPQPLAALWERADLGCAFMCGYPLSRASAAPIVLAAPVPSSPASHGRPVYWTDVVVRADSPFAALTDAFGKRMAYTSLDSQSGYHALRELCAPFASAHGGRLFAATVGPLVTPRAVVAAVVEGRADAGPLDSYCHELIRADEPRLAARLRVIATTPPTPIPPFVAAPNIAPEFAARLRAALFAAGGAPELAATRAILCLERFVEASAADYAPLAAEAARADAMGYAVLR
jgi:ABC-type phosphate/phosphonate transport system substrate-binding protein